MATSRQITAYVAKTFNHLHAQTSDHGAGRGSIQVFDNRSVLVADIDTRLSPSGHDVSLRQIGDIIRRLA